MSDKPRESWRPALAAALLAPALHVARFGYAFGFSDQDEFLPWLLHRLDPSLLSTDWFVGVQESGFNVRSGFMALLEPIATFVGVEPAVAFLYGVAWLILGLAVYDLMLRVTRSPAAAVLGAVAVLVVFPRWTVGGNALTSSMLVPSMLAWSVGMAAFAMHFRGRTLLPGLLLGAAAWLQPLVAFTVGFPLLVSGIARGCADRTLASAVAREGIRVALPAVVVVLPIAVKILLSRSAPVSPDFEPAFADMLMRFRAPHHYLPGAFPLADWLQVLVLGVAGTGGLVIWRKRADTAQVRYLVALLTTAAAFLVVGAAGIAVPVFALVQPFKVTVLSGVVLTALATAGLTTLVEARHGALLPRLDRTVSRLAFPVAAAVTVAFTLLSVTPVRAPDSDIAGAADWFRSQPDARVTVAVPPSSSGFRYRSGRGVVVTFKAVPFDPADAAAWYRRLSDIAPGATVPTGSDVGPLLERLDDAFEKLTPVELDRIGDRYGVSWVVRRTPLEPETGSWSLVGRHGTVLVYRRTQEAGA